MAKIKAKKQENIKATKKNKAKAVKERPVLSEEAEQIRKFIIIFIVVCILLVGVYVLTKVFIKDKNDVSNETVAGEIQYDKINVGMILNRPYDNYFVMVYDSEDTKAMYYSNLITVYSGEDDALKIYFCDLNNSMNAKYKSEKETGNKDAKTVKDFSFGDVTLIEVKNGKIVKYIEKIETIKNTLQ